jgi:hypothetical protein
MARLTDKEQQEAYDEYLRRLHATFPRFRLVAKKDSLFSRTVNVALCVVTFGAQRSYMTQYHTVIGNTLYLPLLWEKATPVERLITLRHERVHLEQRRRYGDVVMTFLYLLPILPLGLAYGRARIEWEAYSETIRATAEYLGIETAKSQELRKRVIQQFTSGAYGWMWPFPRSVGRWYDLVIMEIEAGHALSSKDLRKPS